MFLWFVGCAWAIVWNVFRDPGIDYRVLAVGAVLPDVVDLIDRHRVAHSVTVSVATLMLLMLGTIGRKAQRKRLLMLPIGMLLHLVVDGAFSSTRTFWWPASGLGVVRGRIPTLERPWGLNIAFELIGALILRWFWQRFELADRVKRSAFVSTGRLPSSAP